ncbi:hypothetical protein [Chelativorans intermedius]|uniref:CRISPR-associated protein, Cse2 family n=1 Tax=Chelativorans intermedius TaxID=515947 RepID=A0ABV6DD68_9HYPH|nr:hypothetical protein [Chelativorans intermedius]MCT8999209.1 hypothetical protein [Chelativorans intermedius]
MSPEQREEQTTELGAKVARLAGAMLKLEPGALARLRRMDVEGPGEPDFWRLATELDLPTHPAGLRLVRIMALLAPKGDPGNRAPLHRFERPLGTVLCEAGLSEARLARFLALPFERRGPALESMARFINAARAQSGGVNCHDIACLLFSTEAMHARRLAGSYYRCLDRAARQQDTDEKKEPAA